jgi:hypothetical protein
MRWLRESVSVKTPYGEVKGNLFIGADGLPEVRVEHYLLRCENLRPATFPAGWSLSLVPGESGILLGAWNQIQELQTRLAQAERDVERDSSSPT